MLIVRDLMVTARLRPILVFVIVAVSLIAQAHKTIRANPSGIAISSAAIPPHGTDIGKWNSKNVFDLSASSTYPDNSPGDWKRWVSTSLDASSGGIYQQDLVLRKTAAPERISDINYSGQGTIGPAKDVIGMNQFTAFDPADNDRSSVNYAGPYFARIGDGPYFARFFESSGFIRQCTDATRSLLPGCSESIIITPGRTGQQNLHVWLRTEGINGLVSVTDGSSSQSYALPISPASAVDEEVVTISVNAPSETTAYVITLSPISVQPGAAAGFIGFNAASVGGDTAGNVPDTVLASPGHNGAPDRTYGTRIRQIDPPSRIPPATRSVTLQPTDSLKAAVESAAGGTDIHVPSGFICHEQIVLPNRSENGWVRVIADGAKNTFGIRANPADYPGGPNSPAIFVSPGQDPSIRNDFSNQVASARGAHHYAFVGFEFVGDPAAPVNYGLVQFFSVSGVVNELTPPEALPHDIVFQGVYMHRGQIRNLTNGMQIAADAFGIYDSYISDIRTLDYGAFGNENHGIGFAYFHGPVTLKNNYFQAASEDILFGGGPSVPFMVGQDIEITGNFFDKDLALNIKDSQGNYPQPLDVKNELEFKFGRYVTISGNVFEHSIAGNFYARGQGGQCIFIRNASVGGSQPQDTAHILIENNILRNSAMGIQIESYDLTGTGYSSADPNDFGAYSKAPNHYLTRNYDIMVRNNLLDGFSFTKWGLQGRGGYIMSALFRIDSLPTNLTIDHNSGNFDWAADYRYITTSTAGQGPDVSLEVEGSGTITNLDAARMSIAPPSPQVFDESAQTWVFTNNILAGGQDGSGGFGGGFFSQQMTFNNNSFFGVLPAYLDVYLENGNRPFPPNSSKIFGNTHTQSTTMPAVSGRGVDPAKLPDDCLVITGNRSDVSCTSGQ